jgi:hypothetical protein
MYNPVHHKMMEPRGACFPQARLAEAWVPYQCLMMVFDPAVGLMHGTIFPELVRPYDRHPCTPKWY